MVVKGNCFLYGFCAATVCSEISSGWLTGTVLPPTCTSRFSPSHGQITYGAMWVIDPGK
jgi:hypothetical protein